MAETASDREVVRTACPRDCYDSCGVVVVKHGGRITRVLGDRDDPGARGALCGKCAVAYNGVWLDPRARVLRPLKRVRPKPAAIGDEPRFERATWSEALSTIATGLKRILAESGGQTVVDLHYTGTNSILAGNFPLRFFNRLGATEVEGDTVCNQAAHMALDWMYGSAVHGFDPRTARDAKTILVWGANPSASAPHVHAHWLREAGATRIVVDPVRHPTAAEADIHLQVRPGSDAVLAFAMLHVMRREGLLDQPFLDAHVLGWDELAAEIDRATPEWAGPITGIEPALIAEVARLYAGGPSLLFMGQGLARQPLGGNAFRAVATLPAATGNLAKPGAGFLFLNGKGRRGIDMEWLTAPHLRREPAPQPLSVMELAVRLEDPDRTRALVVWNTNPLASYPEQDRLARAMARDDLLTVVIDPFMTDTACFADWVLPAASFLEFDDLISSYFHLYLTTQTKAAEPMGDALPNQEIFRRLATAMGWEESELYESDAALLDHIVAGGGIARDFADLREKRATYVAPEPVLQFADFRFATPSGRIELASAQAEAAGAPRVPRAIWDAPPADGRLRLLSPSSPWHLNATHSNDPRILELAGPATVTLHPDDAAARGLVAGARAVLATAAGHVRAVVAVSDIVPQGVALHPKGRWTSLEPAGNVNRLNGGVRTDFGDANAPHGIEVTITAAP